MNLTEPPVMDENRKLADPDHRPWPWWPSALNERARQEAEAVAFAREVGHPEEFGDLDLSHGVVLYLEDISVSFDGFRALDKLSIAIDAGELRCIIGPNGAGKTTMMDRSEERRVGKECRL